MAFRRLPMLAVASVVLAILLSLQTLGVTGIRRRLNFQTLAFGFYSSHVEPGYYVVNTQKEWEHVWMKHTHTAAQSNPPQVDFSKYTVIAVFMGQYSTGGCKIRVREIIDTGLSVIVRVERTHPGKGCIVIEALTQPYHIVMVEKISKPVIFSTYVIVNECKRT